MLLFGVMLLSFCCVIYRVVFKNGDGSVQSGSAGDLQSGLMTLA